MIQEKINLRQARDFGETFNTSIRLLRQNFKIIFLSVLFIAGPFILLASISGAYYQANAMRNVFSPLDLQSGNPMDFVWRQFGMWYFIFIVAVSIAHMVLTATVYSFIICYQEKGPGNVTLNDVGTRVGNSIGKILATYFLVMLLSVVGIAVLAGIVIGVAVASAGLAILLGFFIIIGLMIVGPPLVWQISTIYLAVMQPDIPLAKGLGKPFRVIRGSFWWTWVIVVCVSIAVGLMGLVFTLPQAGYQMVLMITSKGSEAPIGFLVVATICTFFATLLYSVMHIVFGVHYYSLAEKQDGQGMIERINEIGKPQSPDANLQY
jgi:hypothetical protein